MDSLNSEDWLDLIIKVFDTVLTWFKEFFL